MGSKTVGSSGKLYPFLTILYLVKDFELPWFYLADSCASGCSHRFGAEGKGHDFSKVTSLRQEENLNSFPPFIFPLLFRALHLKLHVAFILLFPIQPGQDTHYSLQGFSHFCDGFRNPYFPLKAVVLSGLIFVREPAREPNDLIFRQKTCKKFSVYSNGYDFYFITSGFFSSDYSRNLLGLLSRFYFLKKHLLLIHL